MDEQLQLAESYYAVARDMHRQAQWMAGCAENLNRIADSICAAHIKNNASPPSSRESGAAAAAGTESTVTGSSDSAGAKHEG